MIPRGNAHDVNLWRLDQLIIVVEGVGYAKVLASLLRRLQPGVSNGHYLSFRQSLVNRYMDSGSPPFVHVGPYYTDSKTAGHSLLLLS